MLRFIDPQKMRKSRKYTSFDVEKQNWENDGCNDENATNDKINLEKERGFAAIFQSFFFKRLRGFVFELAFEFERADDAIHAIPHHIEQPMARDEGKKTESQKDRPGNEEGVGPTSQWEIPPHEKEEAE